MNEDFYYYIMYNMFELSYEDVIRYAKDKSGYDRTKDKLNKLINEKKPTVELYKILI